MDQNTSDALINLHPSGGRLLLIGEAEKQKTWSALAFQEIAKNAMHIRARDLGSKEAAS